MRIIRASLWVLLTVAATGANASPIFYTATDLDDTTAGIDLWRYDYSIGNDSGFDLSAFTIYFDFALYDFQLSESSPGSGEFIVGDSEYTAPADWDAFVAPDADILGVLEPGFYNLTSLAGGIPSGTTLLGGFSVTFAFTGAGTPGSQFFEYFGQDAFGNPVVGTSFTQLLGGPQPVPAPGTLSLVLIGLITMARRR